MLTQCRSLKSTLFPYTTLFRSVVHQKTFSQCVHDHENTQQYKMPAMPVPHEDVWQERNVMKTAVDRPRINRSEEHMSELQSQFHLVCRLLLEKKKISEFGLCEV